MPTVSSDEGELVSAVCDSNVRSFARALLSMNERATDLSEEVRKRRRFSLQEEVSSFETLLKHLHRTTPEEYPTAPEHLNNCLLDLMFTTFMIACSFAKSGRVDVADLEKRVRSNIARLGGSQEKSKPWHSHARELLAEMNVEGRAKSDIATDLLHNWRDPDERNAPPKHEAVRKWLVKLDCVPAKLV